MLVRLFILLISITSFSQAHVRPPLKIVTTFSILQSLVQELTQDQGKIDNIVPQNVDPHTYQPTPTDVRKLAHADLVIINGLGFEGWLNRLIDSSGYKGKIVTASDKVAPRKLLDTANGNTVVDPHAWHNVKNIIIYVENITAALCELDSLNKDLYNQRSRNLIQRLEALDKWVTQQFDSLPPSAKKVITTHDAFWYYGAAYGIEFLSPVGVSTEAQPSPANISDLIEQIRQHKVTAIFIENLADPKIIQRIAEEGHVSIGGTLYADSLSTPEGPATTYENMIRHNTLEIRKAFEKTKNTSQLSH